MIAVVCYLPFPKEFDLKSIKQLYTDFYHDSGLYLQRASYKKALGDPEGASSDFQIVFEMFNNKIEQQKTDKASGNQKLKDLGLDDEEIKALTGA